MTASINTAILRFLLALVLLAPLPFGSNRPWAWSLLAIAVGILLSVWCVCCLMGSVRAQVPLKRLLPVALPFMLVLVWAFAQSLALLPPAWWHPLWADAAQVLERPVAGGVSIDPAMTRTAILRLLTYAGVFWLAVQLGRERSRAREVIVSVAVAGCVYAAYGLAMHFSGWERILWIEKWAYAGDLTATFVNRNAYGAYAGIGVLCCVALFMHALRPPRPGAVRRIFDFTETMLVQALPFLVGAAVIGSALLLSHSRGAFLATGFGLFVLLLAVAASRLVRPRVVLAVGLLIAALGVGVVGVSGEGTVERLAYTVAQGTDHDREELYRLTVNAIEDAPWTGHGLGTFLPAFRMYRDTALSAPTVWDYAHNIHLETAMDLGLPAAALLAVALGVVIATCLRGVMARRRDQIYPAVAIAVAMLIGAHGLVDFSAQMPAIAVTLALLLGVGYAQSWRTAED